ncbi:MAG: DUF4019 domain-containing protein [Betaproteobacteria bacterium]
MARDVNSKKICAGPCAHPLHFKNCPSPEPQMNLHRISIFIACTALVMVAASYAATTPNVSEGDIGYPSVAAAFEALKAKPGVKPIDQGGWTIIAEDDGSTIWSFTPPGHAAYPAVVKRRLVKKGNDLTVDMAALCQAEKSACDKLVEEFKQLNERMKQTIAARTSPAATQTASTSGDPAKDKKVEKMTQDFFKLRDAKNVEATYELMTASQRATISKQEWLKRAEEFTAKAGEQTSRTIKKVTWYKDPPGISPGIYAAVDFFGTYANLPVYCGYIAWQDRGDGTFGVQRLEEGYIDTGTFKKLSSAQVEDSKRAMMCR